MPPSFQRFATDACAPLGEVKPTAIMPPPTMIRATMATILIMENQNSISPKFFTETRFRVSSTPMTASAGIHACRSGHHMCR